MNALLCLGIFGAAIIAAFGVVLVRAWLRDRAETKRWVMDPVRPVRGGHRR